MLSAIWPSSWISRQLRKESLHEFYINYLKLVYKSMPKIILTFTITVIWDDNEDGHTWPKDAGHYDHLLIKVLISLDGTFEFNLNSASIIMTSVVIKYVISTHFLVTLLVFKTNLTQHQYNKYFCNS